MTVISLAAAKSVHIDVRSFMPKGLQDDKYVDCETLTDHRATFMEFRQKKISTEFPKLTNS